MTRNIFTPPVATLDVIVYAVLASLGFTGLEGFNTVAGVDGPARRNAVRFVEHFGSRKIAAIKAIREVSGLGLRDAKEAYEQVISTYVGDEEHYRLVARQALEDGRYGDAEYYIGRARQASADRPF